MIRPNFIDEIDCGSFFDHIDDLLEFPGDDADADAGVYGTCDNDAFPAVWPTESDSLPCSDSVFSGTGNSDLSGELSVPYEDIVQLEWLSNFVEDSFSDKSLTINSDESMMTKKKDSSFRTSSPVSVLESSSSSSVSKTVPPSPPPQCGRARSKRARPAMFNPPRSVLQIISPTSSVTKTTPSDPPCDSFAESRPLVTGQKPEKKKKKIKLASSGDPLGGGFNQVPSSLSIRKCMHCEITKTPQWRAGPMGPKTLCNACGVRFKSGRLFPEYRPAASPTFVPSVHSNSHKKVIEMRSKGVTMDSPSSPELIPNTNSAIYSITLEILGRKPRFMKESLSLPPFLVLLLL